MKKFLPERKCIKCGNPDPNDLPYVRYDYAYTQYIMYFSTSKYCMEEYLLRTCARCGFEWREAVIDSGDINE